MPPRLIRLAAALMLFLGAMQVAGAEPAPAGWQAVLVAGDNAEPVFDNAVAAVGRWLAARGVAAGDIHRLSARAQPGDAAVAPASAPRILQQIAALRPLPGQRCLVFITSHGKEDEGVWLAYDRDFLRPAALARALSAGCGAVPTVVIVSSCYSGAFTRGAMRAPNRIILSAARADRPSFGCQADRTFTVFDECLLAALPQAPSWRFLYRSDLDCVHRRERRMHVLPSQPQAFFGTAVHALPVP
jgi:hypothetical protein